VADDGQVRPRKPEAADEDDQPHGCGEGPEDHPEEGFPGLDHLTQVEDEGQGPDEGEDRGREALPDVHPRGSARSST
jgi:hypothetical protein